MWIIVNLSFCDEGRYNYRIPNLARPSYIHTDKESAEQELLRLKNLKPRCDFVLFAAIATARRNTVDENLFMIERMNVADE